MHIFFVYTSELHELRVYTTFGQSHGQKLFCEVVCDVFGLSV